MKTHSPFEKLTELPTLPPMEMEISIPSELALMTLPSIVLFPQSLLPLHIFEPRYREMLKDCLATHRLFAVASQNPKPSAKYPDGERPYRIASVGIVRACQHGADGTANLLIQGLARIQVVKVIQESPYRLIQINALKSQTGATPEENASLRLQVTKLLITRQRLTEGKTSELTAFLKTVQDPETLVDLAAFSLCEDAHFKQKLLAELDINARLRLFAKRIQADIDTIKLRRKLQGTLTDDAIADN